MKILATVLTGLLVLLLLASAFFGITGGLPLVREARPALQVLATATELAYGLAALGALVALADRHRSARALLIIWAVCLTLTSGLAPVVWGRAAILVGVESGAGASVVLALLLWGWRWAVLRASGGTPGRAA